jgi:hypothetical protein
MVYWLRQRLTSNPALEKSTMLSVKAFLQALSFASQNFKVH